MKKAVLYARVSSKEQEREGYSIPAQLKLLRNYALEKGYAVDQEYVDIETAKRTGRTTFNKMISHLGACKDGVVILVEKTDRLYRNIRDWVTLDEYDVEIHFVKENFILSKESKSSEKFLHGIKVLIAKNYIDNLSEEVKKGMLEKAEQGEWPSRAPIGYRNNKETHVIDVDSDKAPFIARLFELYATGRYSLEALVREARESGLFSRISTAINKTGIHRMLNNPIYHGEFIWKGKRYRGTHKPIITKRLFDDVQEVFRKANHGRETKRKLPFAGLLTCHKCGCSMTPELQKGRYVYYRCTGYRGKCGNEYIREEKLADLLSEVVSAIHVDLDNLEEIKAALRESHKDKVRFQTEAFRTLQKKYTHLQRLLDRAYEAKLSGTITTELWKRKSAEWNEELLCIQGKIDSHKTADMNYFESGVKILELANQAHDLYLSQERYEQRKLLDTILLNCSFYRGTLYPTYRKPFDILAEGSDIQTKRP